MKDIIGGYFWTSAAEGYRRTTGDSPNGAWRHDGPSEALESADWRMEGNTERALKHSDPRPCSGTGGRPQKIERKNMVNGRGK